MLVVSTVSPETPIELDRRLAPPRRRRARLPDQRRPVAGGEPGELAVMVGGDPAACLTVCGPVLEANRFATSCSSGPSGTAQIAKLANNLIWGR